MIAEKKDMVESVEQALLQFISESEMKIGDALPSEINLSSQLKVGRATVREGLSRLRAMGLIYGNKRGGNVLCKPRLFSSLNRLEQYRLLSPDDIQGLMRLRIMLELGNADFVFRNATNADFRELRSLLCPQGEQWTGKDDILFHRRMFQIGCSTMQEDFNELLAAVFNYENYDFVSTVESHVSHENICEELEHGTEESFNRALKQHLSGYSFLFLPNGTTQRPVE